MANLSRFDPFREMLTLHRAMDRLFEDSVVSPASFRTLSLDTATNSLTPPLDLYQTQEALVVSMALPGVKPSDVSVTITGQSLQIKGEFKADADLERDDYLHRERRYGSFQRQIHLPVRVQGETTSAKFVDGVLTLTIPKAEEVKPRRIEIETVDEAKAESAWGDDSGGGASA
jgi:HSP20 family protein